jgi:hypothetical protein
MTVGRGRAERNQGRDGGTYTSGGGGRVLARLLDCLVKLDDFLFLQEAIKSKFNLKNTEVVGVALTSYIFRDCKHGTRMDTPPHVHASFLTAW